MSATEVHIGSHWALLGEVAGWTDTSPPNSQHTEDNNILFSVPQRSRGPYWVKSVSLGDPKINVHKGSPIWEYGYWDDYVGRSTSDGIHMCGGLTFHGPDTITASCYLLTTRGYENMPRPLTNRRGASSVGTPFGWWVTGTPV